MRRKRNRNKRSNVVPKILISLCALIAIYIGMSLYFTNHFYFGCVINGINVGGKTVEQVDKEISSKIDTYILELEERNNEKEQIKGSNIGLKYDESKIHELKDSQKPFEWIVAIFNKKDEKLSEVVTYDEKLLKECFEKLSCFNSKNINKPRNASFKYTDDGYTIMDEVPGNEVDKDILYEKVVNAILKNETTLNLESSDCYKKPKYTSDSKETIEAKNVLDKYTNSKVTYSSRNITQVLDGSIINNWLEVNENMEVIINEQKVKNYINTISGKYNTFANDREFVTTSKATIKVSGGNYGWIVDKPREVKELIKTVQEGQAITREPIYAQTAFSNGADDIGDTYVELDITKQHLWFYKKGSLVVEGDVVTGNVSNNWATPAGTYRLNYKEKNATLKGENYSSEVTFWMPFNGNIGIHDAVWRTEFGKQIYLTSGSHGCVNAPYELANTIFDNIESGTPIVCYY